MIIIIDKIVKLTTMRNCKTFVLNSAIYKNAFEEIFSSIPWKPHHLEFLVEAETTSQRFFRTLLAEETGQNSCSSEQATLEGEKVLLLLDRLYFLIDETAENHRLITWLAVSTGVWIAERKGEIRELDLIVSGIGAFANQSVHQHDLEELYEISLRILYAVDDFLKADLNKQNPQRPWRLLCLNHCIIATRTGNGDLARMSYDRLIEYLPEEAEAFFKMGMQKVSAGNYSLHCRSVLQAYYQMYSSDHPQKEMNLN